MKLHKSDIPLVVSTFIEQHVMPKATGWVKVGCGAVAFIAHTRLESLVNNDALLNTLRYMQLLDEGDNVDVDYLRELAIDSTKTTEGMFPPIMGYTLDISDIDVIYNIAAKHAVTTTTTAGE